MDMEQEMEVEFLVDPLQNAFTGSPRESLEPPAPHDPICLISYEITVILLGDGPRNRSSFWKAYRRELALNNKTKYQNYHVQVCRHELLSLRLQTSVPVYFRDGELVAESHDPALETLLKNSRFQQLKAQD